MPTKCNVLNAGGWILIVLDSAPLTKQSKVVKFQMHNPVRETVVPITHDKLKSVNWSIYYAQIVQNSLKIIIILQSLLKVILFDVCVLEYKGNKFRKQVMRAEHSRISL